MAGGEFDLLVIGGGINGAGIARDAAMRGLSVCLVEQNDWGCGTSARSSMLAHGGLRYLEQFELGLVHEALQDRELLLHQAPHLVRPLRFVYPIYPHIASRRTVGAGMWLYDLLSHGKSMPRHDRLRPRDVERLLPGIRREGLLGAASYHDGQWRSVERFVLELVQSARRHGATCLNHTRATLRIEAGTCVGAWLAPQVPEAEAGLRGLARAGGRSLHNDAADQSVGPRDPGARRPAHDASTAGIAPAAREAGAPEAEAAAPEPAAGAWGSEAGDGTGHAGWRVDARATINAAGPWVDRVLDVVPQAPKLIRATRGSHIVVPRFVDVALIIRAKDGRTFFILPWQEHTVIGTTDIDDGRDPAEARASADEVVYLQESARWYFPDAPLDDIRWTYAGIRPLIHQDRLTESHVTRRHTLHDHAAEGAAGLWSIQGGKLTTYRHLSEHAVATVARWSGRRDLARLRPTRKGTLPGGPVGAWDAFRADAVAAAMAELGLDEGLAAHLVDTHGANWRAVAGHGSGLERVAKDLPWLWCQVDHAVLAEQATTVGDIMLRRTQLGLWHDGRPRVAREVGRRMAHLLGWDTRRLKHELAAYAKECAVFAMPRPQADV